MQDQDWCILFPVCSKSDITKYFNNLPVVSNANEYPYVLFPLTDYPTPTPPSLFSNLAKLIIKEVNFSQTQAIVGQADRGSGPWFFPLRLN